jgi:hypothetical protein
MNSPGCWTTRHKPPVGRPPEADLASTCHDRLAVRAEPDLVDLVPDAHALIALSTLKRVDEPTGRRIQSCASRAAVARYRPSGLT